MEKAINFKIIDVVGDIYNDNTDVEVQLNDRRYAATFFTIENVKAIMERYKTTGESLSGSYFWSANLIIVKDLSETSISSVIADLVRMDEFENAFQQISEES